MQSTVWTRHSRGQFAQKSFSKKLGTALLLTTAIGLSPAFGAGEGPTIVDRWIEDAKSLSFLDMSYTGMSYDEVNDLTEVSGLKVIIKPDFADLVPKGQEVPEFAYIFKIPTLRYFGLREDSARYYANLIEAPTVTFEADIKDPMHPDVDMEASGTYRGLAMKAADWSKLPDIIDDPLKPISKYYPLAAAAADANWETMTIVGAQARQDVDSDTELVVDYGPSSMGPVVAGNYASLRMEGVSGGTVPKGDKPLEESSTFNFSTGPITGSNYNAGSIIRMFDPSIVPSRADTPFETMISDIRVSDMKASFFAGGTVNLENLSYSDWGIRPAGVSLLAEADRLYLQSKESDQEPDAKELIRLVAELYGMFRIGSFDVNGFALNVDDHDVDVAFDKFQIAGLSALGLENFQYSGSVVKAMGNLVKLGNFQISDIGFPPLDALMDLERAAAEEDIAAMIAAIPTVGLVELAGLDIQFISEDIDVKLDLARMEMSEFIGRLPTNISSVMNELELIVAQMDSEPRREFEKLGYETLNISYALSLVWKEAQELLAISASTKMVDGGEVNANLEIGGVPRSVFEHPEMAQNSVPFLTFNTASFLFDDNSIVGRAIDSAAAQQDKSPEQLKQELVGMLPFVLGMLNKPDFVNDVGVAVSKMLDSEGKLTATAQPAQPVSIMQVIAGGAAAPGALIDLLQVEVSAE